MFEIRRLCVLRRQNLQQHAAGHRFTVVFAATNDQSGRQLFGALEVIFEAGRKGIPLETDHALIAFALFRRDGNDQISVTDHGFQVRPFRDLALDAGYTAHLLLVVAVDHRQRQRAIALQLNGNIAGELQRGGQQAGGNQQFRQHGFHRLRVAMVGQNLF